MAIGPGKYDDICTTIRESVGGSVIVLIKDGVRGSGFSCQADLETLQSLPEILESIAEQLRNDRKKMNAG